MVVLKISRIKALKVLCLYIKCKHPKSKQLEINLSSCPSKWRSWRAEAKKIFRIVSGMIDFKISHIKALKVLFPYIINKRSESKQLEINLLCCPSYVAPKNEGLSALKQAKTFKTVSGTVFIKIWHMQAYKALLSYIKCKH